eukprot:2520078-Alexandrium_andersonii.AAC.1
MQLRAFPAQKCLARGRLKHAEYGCVRVPRHVAPPPDSSFGSVRGCPGVAVGSSRGNVLSNKSVRRSHPEILEGCYRALGVPRVPGGSEGSGACLGRAQTGTAK